MPSALPAQYTSLRPFQGFFETGVPCLMYHKLGPRPRHARIKGLYVTPRLFARQMRELRSAGFSTPPHGHLRNGSTPPKSIALTFDDGFVNAFHHGLPLLAEHRFRAIQFLVADLVGQFNEWEVAQNEVREPLMDPPQVREWLAAGHEIGAHTLTHPYLTRISFRDAREEIFASKRKLEDQFGVPIRHFCYPYGDWNEPIRELVREAGYETACTTDFGINTSATPPLGLKRIMARHQSLSIKGLKARLRKFSNA